MEEQEYKGFTIKIHQDEFAIDPREDFDHLGTMACWHARYNLGDPEPREQKPAHYLYDVLTGVDPEDEVARRWNENELDDYDFISAALDRLQENAVVLPLALLDHSGLWIRAGYSFAEDPGGWDTSRVGFIFVTHEKIKEEYGAVNDETLEKARKCLFAEVEEYSHYLEGAVYDYTVEDPDGETIDGCGGYYGDHEQSGLLDDAKKAIDFTIAEYEEERAQMTALETGADHVSLF